jgi:hypothetical protein
MVTTPEKIRRIGTYVLPYVVAISISGCSVRTPDEKEQCLFYYDQLLGPNGLADTNHDEVLDVQEQSSFLKSIGYKKLMTGDNFPEIFKERADFKRYLNITWHFEEERDALRGAYNVYHERHLAETEVDKLMATLPDSLQTTDYREFLVRMNMYEYERWSNR